MDNYSYDPNSRIARRIKERERKRRKLRRIVAIIVSVIVFLATVFFAIKLSGVFGGSKPLQEEEKPNVTEQLNQTPPAVEEQEEPEEKEEEPSLLYELYPPASEVNDIKKILQDAKGETEKVCALTFDDGPNKTVTPEILEVLKKHEVEATFFVVGDTISKNKELAKRIYDEGHLLANHTYTQNTSVIYNSWDALYDEIQKTEEAIKEVTGEEPFKLVRLPGGSGQRKEYCRMLAENGYYYADWNLAFDGAYTKEKVLTDVKENTGSKSVIILLEEKMAGAEALDEVITHLKGAGYVFKRLDKIAY